MPFKSKAQRRFMYAAESRGEIKPGTSEEWQRKTKKTLPETTVVSHVDSDKEASKQKSDFHKKVKK